MAVLKQLFQRGGPSVNNREEFNTLFCSGERPVATQAGASEKLVGDGHFRGCIVSHDGVSMTEN
jgi:hypothetical protein